MNSFSRTNVIIPCCMYRIVFSMFSKYNYECVDLNRNVFASMRTPALCGSPPRHNHFIFIILEPL